MIARNQRKISGCRILSDCSLFLKDEVQDKIVLTESVLMKGVVISIPNKACNIWRIHWYNESISQKIPLEYFQMHVPKENARLKQKLFQGCNEYDKVHPCTNKKEI